MRKPMPKLILLVDDDVTVLASLFPTLEQAGHRVIVAPGGKEAARAMTASRFDVLVTDIFMPELDGLELIRLARTGDAALRVVAMSDFDRHSGFHILAIAAQLGADATLQKPIATEALLRAVDGLPSPAFGAAMRPSTHEEIRTNAGEF
jgi:CheY-like chemotaxis protein